MKCPKCGMEAEERIQGADLIKRSVLKKELTSATRDKFVFVCLSWVFEKIDNVPPVEITDYSTGYQDDLANRLNDIRPQGEWEFFSIGNNQYSRCSVCKDEHTSEGTDLDWWYKNFKYCPKCGVRMIKGDEL